MAARIISKCDLAKLSADIEDYPYGLVFVVNKPYRWTSTDAVRRVKRDLQNHFHRRNIKVGHAGTLDPLATGILLICAGRATKMAETLQAEKKEYIAKIKIGATTPCFDKEHPIDKFYPYKHITVPAVKQALASLTGEQDQIPPLFSAKYIDGKRAYEIARSGEEVEMKPSRVTVYSAELIDCKGILETTDKHSAEIVAAADNEKLATEESQLPELTVRISCSKGTYIRSFARDAGALLGSGGYLSGLTRTSSGGFLIENALSPEEISSLLEA